MYSCTDPVTTGYIDLLEKTNSQISLLYGPLGIAVAILTGLVAVMAIIFAFILWRQGQEYKTSFSKFMADQESRADEIMSDLSQAVDDAIGSATSRLDTATGKGEDEIKNNILELQKARSSLRESSILTTTYPLSVANTLQTNNQLFNLSISPLNSVKWPNLTYLSTAAISAASALDSYKKTIDSLNLTITSDVKKMQTADSIIVTPESKEDIIKKPTWD